MSDDYIDRIAQLLPADVLNSYVEIKDRIVARREELRTLEQELLEIGRRYGVPDIDSPTSLSNVLIGQAIGASGIEINSVWASTLPSWACPCCRRAKAECARLGLNGQMLGKLVAHHDHFEDYMSVVLSDLSKELMIEATSAPDAERFIRRGLELFTRFDRVVICEDCSNAEATAKSLVHADQYFTFTPREVASFLRALPNRPHQVDKGAVDAAYAVARPFYDRRIGSLKRLAEQALRGIAWHEPVNFDDLEHQISRRAHQALRLFGIHDAGYWTLRDMFFPSRKIDAKHAPAWRLKAPPTSRLPNESEIAFVIQGNEQYEQLPEDWSCPCCGREKRETIRWSQNSKRFLFRLHTRNVADDLNRYGRRKIEVCDACGHVFRECGKELLIMLGKQTAPDCPVSIDDVRAIIRPKPYAMHEVNVDAAQFLIKALLSRFDTE